MASFESGITDYAPQGKNQYLRSTKGTKFESYTLKAASVPTETIDGSTEKILQSGEAIAKLTAGGYAPFRTDATDGSGDVANLVGINDTYLPWQLLHRDVEIGVLYDGTVVQAKCFQRNAAGVRIAMTDAVAAALVAKKTLNITFH